MTFSGQTTRSTEPGWMVRVASRWRSTTTRESESSARVPCGPPPCTIATRRRRRLRCPRCRSGAIVDGDDHDDDRRQPEADGAMPLTPGRCGRDCVPAAARTAMGPTSANPIWKTTHVSRITPPNRTTPAKRTVGLADGQRCQRHAAEREHEPQSLGERVRRRSADHAPRTLSAHTVAATAWKPAKIASCSDRYPGTVSDHIQAMPGYIHAAANSQPRRGAGPGRGPSRRGRSRTSRCRRTPAARSPTAAATAQR